MKRRIPPYLNSFLIAIVFSVAACSKADLKKPTTVRFGFKYNSTLESGFHFTQGNANISNIVIEGYRVEGDDIYFSRPFSSPISTDLNGSSEIQDFVFDIPQGEYNQLSFSCLLKNASDIPSLSISGMYHGSVVPVNITFNLDTDQFFDLTVLGKNQNQVVLNHEQSRTADVVFNTDYWFSSITNTMMDNAVVETVNGLDHVTISSTQNTTIYNAVINRLNHTDEAIIN